MRIVALLVSLSSLAWAGSITGGWNCFAEGPMNASSSGLNGCSVGVPFGGTQGASGSGEVDGGPAGGNLFTAGGSGSTFAISNIFPGFSAAGAQGGNTESWILDTAGPVRPGILLYDGAFNDNIDIAQTCFGGFISVVTPWFRAGAAGSCSGEFGQLIISPTAIPVTLGVPFTVTFSLSSRSSAEEFYPLDSESMTGSIHMLFFETDGITPADLFEVTPEPRTLLLCLAGLAALVIRSRNQHHRLPGGRPGFQLSSGELARTAPHSKY